MIDEQQFQALAAQTLDRVLRTIDDEVDPDVLEAVPSDGVLRLDFQGARRPWILNSQRGALQMWLAAEQQAWHFAHASDDPTEAKWVAEKTGEELFATLERLLAEAGVSVEL